MSQETETALWADRERLRDQIATLQRRLDAANEKNSLLESGKFASSALIADYRSKVPDYIQRIHELEQQVLAMQSCEVDAKRYRWLRMRDWFDGPLCVLRNPKVVLTRGSGLGADCPSRDRLDEAIDAALAGQPAPCSHPFSELGIDADGVMWCTACLKKPLVFGSPFPAPKPQLEPKPCLSCGCDVQPIGTGANAIWPSYCAACDAGQPVPKTGGTT